MRGRFRHLSVSLCLVCLASCGGGGGTATSDTSTSVQLSTSATITTKEDNTSEQVVPSVVDSNTGSSYNFAIVTQALSGTASIVNNHLVYTPEANYNGSDSFSYSVTDSLGNTVNGIAKVTVTPVNDPPRGATARIITKQNITPVPVSAVVNDPDLFDTYVITNVTQPANAGSMTIVNNRLQFVPANNFVGSDQFTFTVSDSHGASASGSGKILVYSDASYTSCTTPSSIDTISSAVTLLSPVGCGLAGGNSTHYLPDNTGGGIAVTPYALYLPGNGKSIKANIVLYSGGAFNLGLSSDGNGVVTAISNNFLVRSAQLFADAGYRVFVMSRPTDRPTASPTDEVENIDVYRTLVDQAVDMGRIVQANNPENLPILFAGTSRGAMSVTAMDSLATAVSISSAVTRPTSTYPGRAYIADPAYPNLNPALMRRPTELLWHNSDGCGVVDVTLNTVGNPTYISVLENTLGVANTSEQSLAGGFTDPAEPNPCQARTFHGFLGIEDSAVKAQTDWFDAVLAGLPTNTAPVTASPFYSLPTRADRSITIDLTTYAKDSDGDGLTFSLPYTSSLQGGMLVLTGNQLTYTPPAGFSDWFDQFIYVVEDGHGGNAFGVLTMHVRK